MKSSSNPYLLEVTDSAIATFYLAINHIVCASQVEETVRVLRRYKVIFKY